MPELRFDGDSVVRVDVLIGDPAGLKVGPGVTLECGELTIGAGVRIGVLDADAFREPAGSKIQAARLHLGDETSIARGVRIDGGSLWLGRQVRIGNRTTIRVTENLVLGSGTTVQD